MAEEARKACNKLNAEEKADLLKVGMEVINAGAWWKGIQVVAEPMPHVPEKSIIAVMPDNIVPVWEDWAQGQTGLMCDDGDFGVYAHDWKRFVGKLERDEKLVDTALEWD